MDQADIRTNPDPGQRPNVMDLSFVGVSAKFGENRPITVRQILENIVNCSS